MRQQNKAPDTILLLGTTLLLLLLGMLIGQLLVSWCAQQVSVDLRTWQPDQGGLSLADRNWVRLQLLLSNAFAFALPGLAVAGIVLRASSVSFFGLRKPVPVRAWGWAVVFFVASLPIVTYSLWWNQQLDLPELLEGMEAGANRLLGVIFTYDSWWEFPLTFTAVAIAPAVGEELIFRGILQKQLEHISGKGWVAVGVTALVFSALHLQFAGFLPRFLLGVVLGCIYLWTRNLWVPIIIHLLYNGLQVTAAFATKDFEFEPEMTEAPNPWLALAGLLVAIVAARELRKALGNPGRLRADDAAGPPEPR
jgi:uncharacterized protein